VPKFDILKVSFEFSPKLGVRALPRLNERRESNVPGLFIVGDLADAPIIKVALNQGYEVATDIAKRLGTLNSGDDVLDVVVVGAGPAGIGAALALKELGASYVVLEREKPFNTIQNFPKAKLIFSEPREIESKGNFWFEDAQKEELVDRWEQALDDQMLDIRQPEGVVDIQRSGGLFTITTRSTDEDGTEATRSYTARRVILAIGRRGAVRRLGIPGEELDKVAYNLRDPAEHAGRRVLVVGGGDSAVEAAVSCAEAGAEVTISYRQQTFHRAKLKNQKRLQALIDAGRVKAELNSNASEVRTDHVVLERGDDVFEVPNDDVLIFAGTTLPTTFLRRVGIKMEGDFDWFRASWVTGFALLTYLIYVLKQKKAFWPFGPEHPLAGVPDALVVDLGFRTVDASFWGTALYSVLILAFGIRVYRKYPMKLHKRRYIYLIAFQWVFLFGIPEFVAPFIIERPWRTYALGVPWPLWTGSVVDGPGWTQDTAVAVRWIALGCLVSFVVIPIYVWRNGLRFCSYLCGCGGLAETIGDYWRHLAPRGSTAKKMEWFGKIILVLAVPVTLMTLNDLWRFVESDALFDASSFGQHWYALMVDFWLAAVLGVALYPYLGNRFWCRFFCPLRAFMELLSRLFGRLSIKANDKCIGCGECTRYCQMGIDVQGFAQRQQRFDNRNSACIHCGICIQVCPMEVLDLEVGRDPSSSSG